MRHIFLPNRQSAAPIFACALVLILGLGKAVAADAPTISSFAPESGPVGTTVVINGANFVPPLSIVFAGNASAAGSFTSTKITVTVPDGAQTGPITINTANGSVSTATNFVIGAAAIPVATLAATVPSVTLASGQDGEFTVSLSNAVTGDTIVSYSVNGSAIDGTDYLMLKGTVKVKAGDTGRAIKIVPKGDLEGAAKKTVKLKLESGDGYTVGTTSPVKVKILATD